MTERTLADIPLSVLDLSPILEGQTAAEAYQNSLALAQHVEAEGYHRLWLAEHHNMPGIASSATSVLIGHLAGGTKTLRIGSGGIMLPNHAPLVIAEQFGTLESLYPGRIDLGLGRAPGSDGRTMQALRRDLRSSGDDFPQLLEELRGYFAGTERVHAVPGEGLNIPIWLLGSSNFSAQLAGMLGLPYAFAGQFAPNHMMMALDTYRQAFTPSDVLDKPYAMVGMNVVVAETDEEANYLFTSQQQHVLKLFRNDLGKLQPPVEDMDSLWEAHEKHSALSFLGASVVGSPAKVRMQMELFLSRTGADELMINTAVFDQQKRRESFSRLMEIRKQS
ncbi:LLM class flavin-dependent oxidoreductase [Pokkaliibacter sp. CJK22405]|uniref:LLM class flavin-dependent oxidoreductase n=1 Tax=Pokkaliibacter sp. CJK22405 TaxID=3384615 RepID=UPI0039852B68